jgi:hypothetical protein
MAKENINLFQGALELLQSALREMREADGAAKSRIRRAHGIFSALEQRFGALERVSSTGIEHEKAVQESWLAQSVLRERYARLETLLPASQTIGIEPHPAFQHIAAERLEGTSVGSDNSVDATNRIFQCYRCQRTVKAMLGTEPRICPSCGASDTLMVTNLDGDNLP